MLVEDAVEVKVWLSETTFGKNVILKPPSKDLEFMNSNPYSAPLKTKAPEPIAQRGNVVNFGEIIRRWEWFRVLYNLALLVVTLLVAVIGGAFRSPVLLFETAVLGAVFANILFFYGPVADGYLQWMGFRNPAIGKIIFVMGTTLAMLLAAVTVVSLAAGLH